MSYVNKAYKKGLLTPPFPFVASPSYEVLMGSTAYAVSSDTSDMDIYAMVVSPYEMLFPHTRGYVYGLFDSPDNFEVLNQHHIKFDNKEFDFNVFSVVKYFNLCADNNPNMLDSLFVPDRCVLHIDAAGKLLRDNRHAFLHMGAYHRYRGYFYAQMKKLDGGANKASRQHLVDQFGFDTKFAYHIVRLALQVEQLMIHGDMSLDSNAEILKAIRRGDWTLDELKAWVKSKEADLEKLYTNSKTLPYAPDKAKLKRLFLDVVEAKHGSIDSFLSSHSDANLLQKAMNYDKIVQLVKDLE